MKLPKYFLFISILILGISLSGCTNRDPDNDLFLASDGSRSVHLFEDTYVGTNRNNSLILVNPGSGSKTYEIDNISIVEPSTSTNFTYNDARSSCDSESGPNVIGKTIEPGTLCSLFVGFSPDVIKERPYVNFLAVQYHEIGTSKTKRTVISLRGNTFTDVGFTSTKENFNKQAQNSSNYRMIEFENNSVNPIQINDVSLRYGNGSFSSKYGAQGFQILLNSENPNDCGPNWDGTFKIIDPEAGCNIQVVFYPEVVNSYLFNFIEVEYQSLGGHERKTSSIRVYGKSVPKLNLVYEKSANFTSTVDTNKEITLEIINNSFDYIENPIFSLSDGTHLSIISDSASTCTITTNLHYEDRCNLKLNFLPQDSGIHEIDLIINYQTNGNDETRRIKLKGNAYYPKFGI